MDSSADAGDAATGDGTADAALPSCYERVLGGPTRVDGASAAVLSGVQHYTTAPLPMVPLIFADFFYRRFGIEELSGSLAVYDSNLAAGTSDDAYYRVVRRMGDPDHSYQDGDWASVTAALDEVTFPALYCRDQTLPSDYVQKMDALRDLGGYHLTHVALALIWFEENGCTPPVDASYRSDIDARMATLVDRSDGLDDLEMEAVAWLLHMGRADLVEHADLQAIADAHLPGDGWGLTPASTTGDWHATGLGLWALLIYECPDTDEPLARQR